MTGLELFLGYLAVAIIMTTGFGVMVKGGKGAAAVLNWWFSLLVRRPIAFVLNLIGDGFKGSAKAVSGKKKKKRR